jgi:endo-1,3-1,4-beta-glycanase ExoK
MKMRYKSSSIFIEASIILIFLLTGCTSEHIQNNQMLQETQNSEIDIVSDTGNSFKEEFEQNDTTTWQIADGWSNGVPFWVGWRSDHIEFSNGIMRLRLDDKPCSSNAANCSGEPYASAEYRTNEIFQYGCISGRMKAAGESGVVTSLFTYTGPSDGNPNDEIDIEILGNDTTQMQVNYYTDGVPHEQLVDLGFDAAEDFHTYAFEWSEDTIKWYVDGELVHTEDGSNGALPTTPGKIMMNLWPVDSSASNWAGEFVYPETPIYAEYDWVQYTPSKCMGVEE